MKLMLPDLEVGRIKTISP